MKILLITGLLFISLVARSQTFLLIDPAMRRAGLIYNLQTRQSRIGYYLKCQYGIINVTDFYAKTLKAGSGVSLRTRDGATCFAGLNYNGYYDVNNQSPDIDLSRIWPVSIDIGFASSDQLRFRLLFITDPINWETSIGFTFKLLRKRNRQ